MDLRSLYLYSAENSLISAETKEPHSLFSQAEDMLMISSFGTASTPLTLPAVKPFSSSNRSLVNQTSWGVVRQNHFNSRLVKAGDVEEPLIIGTPYCSATALTVLVTEL